MSLRKYGFTKSDIDALHQVKDNKYFFDEFVKLILDYKDKGSIWGFLGSKIYGMDLHNSLSVTYLTYLVVNNYEDYELRMDYLSELIVEIEDFVEELEKIIEKYLK